MTIDDKGGGSSQKIDDVIYGRPLTGSNFSTYFEDLTTISNRISGKMHFERNSSSLVRIGRHWLLNELE